jgi:CheY-like chemotaxis protein
MARILVIDDEVCVRTAIRLILEHRGHHVVVAECGQYGVEAIEAFAFDAVIVDICMPGMDGFETISILRQSAPKIPIVAISGYAFRQTSRSTPGFLGMARELGVSCCLCKPFKAGEIIEAVETSIGARAIEGQVVRRAGVAAPDASAVLGRS